MSYLELKEKQQKEVNDFPFGFAFSNQQFTEMMQNFGLAPDDYKAIYSLGAGTYIRKSDSQAMEEMFARHKKEIKEQIEKDKTGNGYIFEMFNYE